MDFIKVINLVEKKLKNSDFYEISEKTRVDIIGIKIENFTFSKGIFVEEQYDYPWANEPQYQKWSFTIKNEVFEKSWNSEEKLANKIFKLIYHGGDKGYSYNGRLVWSCED